MDEYVFTCGDETHRLELSRYDAHLVVLARVHPSWRAGIFASHKNGEVARLPIDDAREAALLLLRALERDGDLLQYRYALQRRSPGNSRRSRGGGKIACSFRGERAMAHG